MSLLTLGGADRQPAPIWPLAFLSEVKRPGVPSYALLELAINAPGFVPASGLLMSDGSLTSKTLALFRGKVLKWPELERGVSWVSPGFALPEYELIFDDTDGAWRALLEGPYGGAVRGSLARIRLGTPGRPVGDWPIEFEGVISDEFRPGRTQAGLRLRYDDRWLETEFPKRLISYNEWPNASQEAISNPYPLLYGTHSSENLTDDGLIPTYLVDAEKNWYMPCLGHIVFQNTLHPYGDGAIITSGYSTLYPIRNGLQVTVVQFTASQGSKAITLDVFGYETTGDGSGQPMDRPAYVLAHMLTNFAKYDYASGLWLPLSSGPIDVEDVFAADRLIEGNRIRGVSAGQSQSTDGRAVARYISAKTTGLRILEEWCGQFKFRPFWKGSGKIGLAPVADHRFPRVYLDKVNAWIREREEIGQSFKQRRDKDNVVRRVDTEYVRDESQGSYVEVLQVGDESVAAESIEKTESPWTDNRVPQTYFVLPNATTFETGAGWTKIGAATVHECVAEPWLASDDDARYVSWRTSGSGGSFRCTGPNIPGVQKVLSVTVHFRFRFVLSGGGPQNMRAIIRVGINTYQGSTETPSSSWENRSFTWKKNPNTNQPWTVDGVNAVEFGVEALGATGNWEEVTGCVLGVSCIGEPPAARLVRESESRRLRVEREELPLAEFEGPIYLAANEVCSPVQMSHSPTSAGKGWGLRSWERGLLVKLSQKMNLDRMTVREEYLDLRRQLVTLWETDHSRIGTGLTAPGIARLGSWRLPYYPEAEHRQFRRTGRVAVPHPAQPQFLVAVSTDTEKYTEGGLLIEGGRINRILNSAFINGFNNGWVRTGQSVNGSVINLDSADTIFDTLLGATQSVQTRYGTVAAAGDLHISQAVSIPSTWASNVASVIHKNVTGAPWFLRIRNSTTNREWDDSAGAWGSLGATVWNSLPVTPGGAWLRYVTKPFNLSVLDSVTLYFGVPSAQAVVSQEARLYHLQLETDAWSASNPIVTLASAVTTAADVLTYICLLRETAYPLEQGVLWFEFISDWNSGDLGSSDQVCLWLAEASGDTLNYDWAFYDKASGAFVFRRCINGTVYSASMASSVVRGQTYRLGYRWTGLEGELELAPGTLSIFLDGVKGTDVVAGPHKYLRSPYMLRFGGGRGTHETFGKFRHRTGLKVVLTDGEMAKLPNG